MTSTLILDRSIPEVDALVKNWKDGGVYKVELSIRQLNSDDKRATFDVAEITDLGSEDEGPEKESMESDESEKPARMPMQMGMPKPSAYGEEE